MGQFKPMVKMETTEPSVELKLKKGGSVSKPKKMMDGGVMGALSAAPAPVGVRGGMAPVARPARPSMAARRAAMRGAPMGRPMMAEGGESKAEHKAEMKKMAKTEKELKKHESMPASKAHKGLKTGGVVMGQGGFKKGGGVQYAKGGGVEGNVSSAKPGVTNTKTGEVKKGNAGGYKEGGALKKAYATGGSVNDSGRAVAYPKKPVSKPVKNNLQSGTFKRGGGVKMNSGGVPSDIEDQIQTARNKRGMENWEKMEREENEAMRDMIPGFVRKAARGIKDLFGKKPSGSEGSVTETERSVTVTPAKKKGGAAKR